MAIGAAACGGKKGAPRVTVGSFVVALPAGATQTKHEDLAAGKVMIKRDHLVVILEPMAEPLAVDPADAATCRLYGTQLTARGMTVTSAAVGAIAAGKACLVDASATLSSGRVRWSREAALRIGDHGLTAACSAAEAVLLDGCAALFDAIAIAPGVSTTSTVSVPVPAPVPVPVPVAVPVPDSVPVPVPDSVPDSVPAPATPKKAAPAKPPAPAPPARPSAPAPAKPDDVYE